MNKNNAVIIILTILIVVSTTTYATAQNIFYPRPESEFDERTGFPLTLLQLVFDRIQNGEKYMLKQTPVSMPRGRALMLLEKNVVVDVFWSITSKEREEALLPIKFPIYKGMMGWRVLLINKNTQDKFSSNLTLGRLADLVGIQAHDWADLKILKFNKLKIQGAVAYEELFSMVGKGRVHYFPRSVVEVTSEQPYIDKYDLTIEENILLKYPASMYFFVNKNNLELAKDIEIGLQRAVEDGSYDLLFDSIHEMQLSALNIEKRKVIELENPFFPQDKQ